MDDPASKSGPDKQVPPKEFVGPDKQVPPREGRGMLLVPDKTCPAPGRFSR